MSKRNISYVKPQDPSFLAKLKAEIGYKEGPTVDTKRQKLQQEGAQSDEETEIAERPDLEDEKPQIVVLKTGDLTADEVLQEQQRIAREEAERPADLSQPIVFQKRKPKNSIPTVEDQSKSSSSSRSSNNKNSKKSNQAEKTSKTKSKLAINKLSFNQSEEDDEEVE